MNDGKSSPRGRLAIVQQFASALGEPSERINAIGHRFFRSVIASDPGVRELIEKGRSARLTDANKEEIEGFFHTIKSLADSSAEMVKGIDQFLAEIEQGRQAISIVTQATEPFRVRL